MTGDGKWIVSSAARAAASGLDAVAGVRDGTQVGAETTVVGWAPLNTGQICTNQDPDGPRGAGAPVVSGTQWQLDGVPDGIGADGEEDEDDPGLPLDPRPVETGRPGGLPPVATDTLTVLPLSDAVASASATPANTATAAPIATRTESPTRRTTRLDCSNLLLRIPPAVRLPPPTDARPAAREARSTSKPPLQKSAIFLERSAEKRGDRRTCRRAGEAGVEHVVDIAVRSSAEIAGGKAFEPWRRRSRPACISGWCGERCAEKVTSTCLDADRRPCWEPCRRPRCPGRP